jgi:hypothetical protein
MGHEIRLKIFLSAIFLSSNPLAPYENHTTFSLLSFSKHPLFVNASKLGNLS